MIDTTPPCLDTLWRWPQNEAHAGLLPPVGGCPDSAVASGKSRIAGSALVHVGGAVDINVAVLYEPGPTVLLTLFLVVELAPQSRLTSGVAGDKGEGLTSLLQAGWGYITGIREGWALA